MGKKTVDLSSEDRGVLFNAEDEVASVGWSTDEPYPKILKLMEGPPVQEGSLEELMGLPPQFSRMWEGSEFHTVFSYDLVNEAFQDAERFSNRVYDKMTRTRLGDTLLNMDGGQHTRMRNVSKPFFKPSFTQTWWKDNWINQAVDELFDNICTRDHADLNFELCAPLPMSVVTIGFGVPMGEAMPLRKAVHELTAQHSLESVAAANKEIQRIMLVAISQRRQEPRDDLISKFIAADYREEDGTTRKLTDEEILSYCLLIIFAGGGTTWRQTGITIMALLDNPDQLELLRKDRSLLRPAIQESTRWYPTDPVFLRWVTRDTELGGVKMKAGSILYLCLAAANRDRTQWNEPDRFDITRPMKRHFAFGAGAHACLGQHLSRQEMEVALNALLDRLPNLRWDPDQPHPKMSGGALVARGPNALPVRFDA
jgi:cytochrome P450